MTSPLPGSPGALERLQRRFALVKNEVTLGGHSLILPELANPEAYIEGRVWVSQGGGGGLPCWTKLWPASLALAMLMAELPLAKAGTVLELGAGLGLPGLVAAKRGVPVVLSDQDPDALEFARAAVEMNGLQDLASVISLDWADPPRELGSFATVLGAEIHYQPSVYPTLLELLPRLLAPGGTVFISHQERPFEIGFFDMARGRFRVGRTRRVLRGEEGPIQVFLYALK
jgi:2-polyprenyl-3-methyl-5-hydroxy-6-metoxy-1,4-benzoquinol methylase